jgi:hypothetical protein
VTLFETYFCQPFGDGGRSPGDGERIDGHSTIAMTDRYAHLAPSHASNAIETLTVYAPGHTQTVGR